MYIVLLPQSSCSPWGPLVPLPQWKEEGIRCNYVNGGRTAFCKEMCIHRRFKEKLRLSQVLHEHCLPSALSAPPRSCPGSRCSPYLLFQQLPTFWKCAFLFWLCQLRRPLDKQARIGMSVTVIVRTHKICKAASGVRVGRRGRGGIIRKLQEA